MLQDIQANPKKVGTYMSDPRIVQCMGVLLGINMSVATPGAGAEGMPQLGSVDVTSGAGASGEDSAESARPPPEATRRRSADLFEYASPQRDSAPRTATRGR